MKIGLKRYTVRIVDHDPGWAALFAGEREILLRALGDLTVDVQHVGSTAVPDLPAKPILDIAIALQTLNLLTVVIERLTGIGYIYRGDGGGDGGHLFIRESSPDVRTVHLHVVTKDDVQWDYYLLLRDTLLNNSKIRRKYADFKRELASKFPRDRESYTSGKNEFIQGILKEKGERLVDPSMLTRSIEAADRMIVRETPWPDSAILFESRNREDLDALIQSLVIEIPEEWFHCRCDGTPAVFICNGDDVVLVTNHHGLSIRCSLWDSDARIIDTEKWLTWFDERGMDEPRKEVDESRRLAAQHKRDWKKWISAMPDGLQLVWEDSVGQYGTVDTAPLRGALCDYIPERDEQIRALLSWFGFGAGPWSGFPSYESAAEELLLDYEIASIVDVLETSRLTPEQTEGAARLFSGWNFRKKYPVGIGSVPDVLREVLMNHVRITGDKDKLERVKRAFYNGDKCHG